MADVQAIVSAAMAAERGRGNRKAAGTHGGGRVRLPVALAAPSRQEDS
ncbi:hypothetical protein [Streptomyces sp. NBC_01235]